MVQEMRLNDEDGDSRYPREFRVTIYDKDVDGQFQDWCRWIRDNGGLVLVNDTTLDKYLKEDLLP